MLTYTFIGRFSLRRLLVCGVAGMIIGALMGRLLAIFHGWMTALWCALACAGVFMFVGASNMLSSPSEAGTDSPFDPGE